MRKRNCDKLFDNIMWYTIYLLPILLTLASVGGIFTNTTFADWQYIYDNTALSDYSFFDVLSCYLERLGFTTYGIFEPLAFIFEADLGLVVSSFGSVIFIYLNYFVTVFMLHLCVDFLLFIPRLAHKWLNHAYQGD